MQNMNFYQRHLLDHYHNPRNHGTLAHPDISSGVYNPSCGDSIEIQGMVKDGCLETVVFEGKGCVISQAAASMLTEFVKGKALSEIAAFDPQTMKNLLGIEIGPMRLRCAVLALEALQEAVRMYLSQGAEHA